jgi:hypothetical protein
MATDTTINPETSAASTINEQNYSGNQATIYNGADYDTRSTERPEKQDYSAPPEKNAGQYVDEAEEERQKRLIGFKLNEREAALAGNLYGSSPSEFSLEFGNYGGLITSAQGSVDVSGLRTIQEKEAAAAIMVAHAKKDGWTSIIIEGSDPQLNDALWLESQMQGLQCKFEDNKGYGLSEFFVKTGNTGFKPSDLAWHKWETFCEQQGEVPAAPETHKTGLNELWETFQTTRTDRFDQSGSRAFGASPYESRNKAKAPKNEATANGNQVDISSADEPSAGPQVEISQDGAKSAGPKVEISNADTDTVAVSPTAAQSIGQQPIILSETPISTPNFSDLLRTLLERNIHRTEPMPPNNSDVIDSEFSEVEAPNKMAGTPIYQRDLPYSEDINPKTAIIDVTPPIQGKTGGPLLTGDSPSVVVADVGKFRDRQQRTATALKKIDQLPQLKSAAPQPDQKALPPSKTI